MQCNTVTLIFIIAIAQTPHLLFALGKPSIHIFAKLKCPIFYCVNHTKFQFFKRIQKTTTLGWLLLGLGVLLVYLSGGMLLKPIGMLTFITAFTAMAYGHQLMKRRRMTVSMKH